MSEENKQRLKEYQKRSRETKKSKGKIFGRFLNSIKMKQTSIPGKYCANKFHMHKKPININNVNIRKVLLSNKISCYTIIHSNSTNKFIY